jgi:hypothetical protein
MYSLLAQQVRSPEPFPFRLSERLYFRFLFMPMRVCIDGNAAVLTGTGKSLLLRAIIMALKKKHAHNPDVVSVTASTGMAASNIGGIYRFTSQDRWIPFSDISP